MLVFMAIKLREHWWCLRRNGSVHGKEDIIDGVCSTCKDKGIDGRMYQNKL
jgi:hypothetical protein